MTQTSSPFSLQRGQRVPFILDIETLAFGIVTLLSSSPAESEHGEHVLQIEPEHWQR